MTASESFFRPIFSLMDFSERVLIIVLSKALTCLSDPVLETLVENVFA